MALIEEMESQGNVLFKYRSFIPLLFLFSGISWYLYKIYIGDYPSPDSVYWFVSLFVGLLGLAVRIYTVGHTPANTSGRNTAEGQVAEELNQTGIYSLVRHPLYLGNFLMWLAVGMLTADLWYIIAFVLAYWVYYERIMFAEEAFLRRKFGESYLKWAEDKPAFIPKLRRPSKAKYPFSIKKVLKKEKNGVAALFGLFYLFEITGQYFQLGSNFEFKTTFWFWGFIISLVAYFILKILKRNTTIFEEEGR
jgi:protein-S-isoprenylcysteine O-methyltransferase Ste14